VNLSLPSPDSSSSSAISAGSVVEIVSPPRRRSGKFSRFSGALSGMTGIIVTALALGISSSGLAAESIVREGEITFRPSEREADLAERFRLDEHRFPFVMKRMENEIDGVVVWDVQFPSPVVTPHENNNTVHCEYFQPREGGQQAGVIVLHILGGDFPLSRLFCISLAQKGCPALFLKMPYYGPRRQPDVEQRMISPDPSETVAGMTQAILDIRRATAWLAEQAEVDAQHLGVFGISLGGITGALALTAEPRLRHGCLLLAGGDIGRVAWESPELERIRRRWSDQGGKREEFQAMLQSIDPVIHAEQASGKRILMLNADQDEIIPRECTESLWKAFGEPDIVWYPGGHYSVARFLPNAIQRVTDFFAKAVP
jgi:dienelactone hydrolase